MKSRKSFFVIVIILALFVVACNPEQPIQYFNVKYLNANGSMIATHKVESGKTDTPPSVSKREGYTFIGWSLTKDVNQLFNFNTPISSDINLYSVWEINKYKVTFKCGEGVENPPADQSVVYGSNIKKPTDVTRDGYTLLGWSTKPSESTLYDFGTPVKNDIILYPVWDINSYTITFVTGEDATTVPEQTVDYDEKVIRPTDPTKEGHSFNGWFLDEECSVPFDFNASVTDKITLYASWSLNQYTVSYICGEDVSNIPEEEKVYHGSSVTKPSSDPERYGHIFIGWSTSSTESKMYDFSSKVTGDITLYPVWDKGQFKVSFVCGEGVSNAPENQAVYYESKATKPELDPIREGYTFKGWYTDAEGTSLFDFNTPIRENTSLYPKWEINRYTVTFICGEGVEGVPEPQTVEHGGLVEDSFEVKREGYTFQGWSLDDEGSDIYDISKPVTEKISLYAVWEINKYTVSFVCGEYVTAIPDQTLEHGAKVDKPEDPTKVGHIFKGWALDKDGEVSYDFSISVTKNLTIYAIWEAEQYIVTFVCGEAVVNAPLNQTITYGTLVKEPEGTTLAKHTLRGWSTAEDGSRPFNFNTLITSSIILYPIWDTNKYTATFVCGDNVEEIPSQTVLEGERLNKPEDPTKVGYIFKGWALDKDGEVTYDFSTSVKKDITIYAIWKVEQYTVTFTCGEDVENTPLSQTVTYGTLVKEPEGTTLAKHTLRGWSTTEDGLSPFDFSMLITKSINLYPIWEETGIPVYFYDGSELVVTMNCKEGVEYEFPTIEYLGEGFTVKWMKDGNNSPLDTSSFFISYSDEEYCYKAYITTDLLTISKSGTIKGTNKLINSKEITELVIPNTLEGITVKSIASEAFSYSNLVSITIPNAVNLIGGNAFYSCSKLTNINVPDSVTSIGEKAFYSCKLLTSIDIPDGVSSIGNEAFNYCTRLASIVIPNSVTAINRGTFKNCSSLTSITIPDSVTSIGDSAFYECESLSSIDIPDSVSSIGAYAFYGCKNLTNITIPDSVTTIGEWTFYACFKLTNITIPDSITTIGFRAFCLSGLTSINIPDSVTTIGESAFRSSDINIITIGNGVRQIESGAFFGCSNLSCIEVSNDNISYKSIDGVLFDKNIKKIIAYPNLNGKEYTIPDSVTSIENFAFAYCRNLTSITIPDSVTSIGSNAFLSCTSLANIYIPESVSSIGFYAFKSCNKLKEININLPKNSISGAPWGGNYDVNNYHKELKIVWSDETVEY